MVKPLLLLLVLAAVLRFAGLTFDSLWLDESYQTVIEAYGNGLPDLANSEGKSYLFKPGTPANVASVLANFSKVDFLCPPLYAVLINRWMTVFGGSDFALRGFSVVCSLLSIITIYFFGNAFLGKRGGFYAALLQSISPFDIHYAQEARMYSLLVLLAILSGGSLLYLCLKWRPKSYTYPSFFVFFVIYIVSTWALVNTHYTQLFTWFALVILSIIACLIANKNWSLLAQIAVANLLVGILSLPWVSFFIHAASSHTASYYVLRQSSIFWPFWSLLVRLPLNWILFLAGKKVVLWAAPLYVTCVCLIAYPLLGLFTEAKNGLWQSVVKYLPYPFDLPQQRTTIFLLTVWCVFPALLIWSIDVFELHKVIEIPRYLIGTAPAIYLIAAYALSRIDNKNYFVPFLAVHVLFCFVNYVYMHVVHQREDWRTVAHVIEHACSPGEPLLVCPPYNIICLDRYLHYPFKQIGISPASDPADLKNSLDSAPSLWVLGAQEGDAVFNTIPKDWNIIQRYDYPHALHLRHYVRRSYLHFK